MMTRMKMMMTTGGRGEMCFYCHGRTLVVTPILTLALAHVLLTLVLALVL